MRNFCFNHFVILNFLIPTFEFTTVEKKKVFVIILIDYNDINAVMKGMIFDLMYLFVYCVHFPFQSSDQKKKNKRKYVKLSTWMLKKKKKRNCITYMYMKKVILRKEEKNMYEHKIVIIKKEYNDVN